MLRLLVLALGACTGSGTYYANTDPTPQQHDVYFPISPSSPGSHFAALVDAGVMTPQGGVTANLCSTCHDQTSNTPFAQSTCTGCHTNALSNVPGTNLAGPGCAADGGVVSGQSLQCLDQWHSTAGVGNTLGDGGYGGYFLADGGDNTDCVICHANDEVWRVADHSQRVLGIPFNINPAAGAEHSFLACQQCHGSPRNQPLNGHPPEPWATDFSTTDCTACHTNLGGVSAGGPGCAGRPTNWLTCTDDAHQLNGVSPACTSTPTRPCYVYYPVAGYQYASASCLACHYGGDGLLPDGGQD